MKILQDIRCNALITVDKDKKIATPEIVLLLQITKYKVEGDVITPVLAIKTVRFCVHIESLKKLHEATGLLLQAIDQEQK